MDARPDPIRPTAPAPRDAADADTIADEELMQRYQAGDAAAFDLLYARHRAPLYRFLARQLEGRAETEELFQEVWMNVIQARADYVPQAAFRTWLFTLAHHRAMDFFRRHRRVVWLAYDAAHDDSHAENDAPALAESVAASRTTEPDVAAASREQAAAVLRLLDALPAPQREAFLLAEEAGLSVPEIAAATGVALEAAKSRLRYAYAKLRDGLRDYR